MNNEQTAPNNELLELARAGDKRSRERLILSNMDLAELCVESLVKRFPRLRNDKDDMTSTGYVALVIAIDALIDRGSEYAIENVRGFLRRSIAVAVKRYEDEAEIISPSHSTKKRKRQEEKNAQCLATA